MARCGELRGELCRWQRRRKWGGLAGPLGAEAVLAFGFGGAG